VLAVEFINKLNPKYLTTGSEIGLGIEEEWILLNKSQEKKNDSESNSVVNTTQTTTAQRTTPTSQSTPHHSNSSSVSLIDDLPFSERYKFWNKTSDEITPDMIPELLSEYKRLALAEFTHHKRKS